MTSHREVARVRRIVWRHWNEHGRHDLPWRKTVNPYKILVSEVMLQQTQVPRVIEKYKAFLRRFPTVRALAQAPLSDVLQEWSGLGYNRRGKYLHDAAKMIVDEYNGNFKEALQHSLPGVGPYTRAAVRVFAFNEPHTMIETNVRSVFLHHWDDLCKSGRHIQDAKVADSQLVPFIEKAAEDQDPRTWHWALMDYGSHLKKIHGNPSRKSAHHAKQSKFEGSVRQVRGAILRELHAGPSSLRDLRFEADRKDEALAGLERNGLIVKEGRKWRIK